MDDFEKDYFESLRPLALGFKNKRRELAKSRIKMFAAAIARQVLDEKQQFDLIVGAGNSGLYITSITKLVFEGLGFSKPTILNIPIVRVMEENKIIKVLINDDFGLENNAKIENILFADDEIMKAIVAKTCFELILNKRPEIQHLNATIIAENHFFEWHYSLPKVFVKFFAYSRLIQGLNGNISYIIPEDLFNQIKNLIPEVESYPHAIAIMLGGGLKKIENGKPYFDFQIEKELENKINDYKEEKQKLINEINELVLEGIREYKEGKINFRF
jgi:hypothetical protein